jgi:CubicO group peptidase (beta-lactamase class C family)
MPQPASYATQQAGGTTPIATQSSNNTAPTITHTNNDSAPAKITRTTKPAKPTPVAKPAKTTPVASGDYTAINTQVDAFFRQFINEKTPGGVVIVLQNGQIIHQAAYGLANLKKNTPLTVDHMFHLASMGKQMTSLSIMMLAEQGKLAYDDPSANTCQRFRSLAMHSPSAKYCTIPRDYLITAMVSRIH